MGSLVRTKMFLAAVVAVTLAGGAAGCKKSEGNDTGLPPPTGQGAPPAPTLPAVDEKTPQLGGTSQTGATTGTTYAKSEAKIGPKLSGVIAQIYVKENQVVKKGDPLFRIDSRSIALQREQAEAQLRQAEVNLNATQVEYDRLKGLVEQNAINRAQWDQIQARLDAAKVAVQQAKIGVAQANQVLADTVTRSPMDGIVTLKLMNEGEMATMMPPSVVVVVQDQSVLELRVRLPEKALAQVKPGTALTLTFGAVGVTREAQVTRVSAEVDPRTRTIEVIAELPNGDGALKPGMLADVQVGGAPAKPAPPAKGGTP